MKRMTTSVCMATYNGERYIEEQLYSILHQTNTPDEVIICDDCSSDNTIEKIQKFIADNQLEDSWHIYQNQQNKGYPANFYYACSLCTKEVVFLADQDDIWDQNKLEKMCKVLAENPKALAVCCKFGLIDIGGENIRTIMNPTKNRGTGKLKDITVKDVFYKCEWPGMVVAYRNVWFQGWNQERTGGVCTQGEVTGKKCYISRIPHDFLICARAAEENGFIQLDEELAYHRRHDNNAGGEEHRVGKLLNKQRKLKEIENYLHILEAYTEEKVLQTKEAEIVLQRKLQSMQDRYKALQSGKVGKVLKNAWKHRAEVRLATLICDVVIVRR